MSRSYPLQLTFIPAEYWNKSPDFFHLINRSGKKIKSEPPIPKDSGFFILWLSDDENDLNRLENIIKNTFSSIPVLKLLSCRIRLCFPFNEDNDLHDNSCNFRGKLRVNYVYAKIIPLPPMIPILFSLKLVWDEGRHYSNLNYSRSIKTWAYLTKFTIELLNRGCFIPKLNELDEKEKQKIIQAPENAYSRIYNIFIANWNIVLRSLDDWKRFNSIIRRSPWVSYNLPINLIKDNNHINHKAKEEKDSKVYYSDGLWNSSYIFITFMDMIADFIIRSSIGKPYRKKMGEFYGIADKYMLDKANMANGICWDFRLLDALTGKSKIFKIFKFSETPISKLIEMWTRNVQGFPFQLGVMFTFILEYPNDPDEDWKLSYYIQPMQEENQFIPLRDFWQCDIESRKELENVCEDVDLLEEEIFRALGTASIYFPPIERSLEGQHPQEIYLNTAEVMEFLKYSMFMLIQAGFNVELPDQFKKQGEQRVKAQLVIEYPENSNISNISAGNSGNMKGTQKEAMFGIDSMLEYSWEIEIEGKKIDEEDYLRLINSEEPLVFIKGKWVLLNPIDMQALKPIFNNQNDNTIFGKPKGKIRYMDALKYGILGNIAINQNTSFDIIAKGALQNIIGGIMGLKKFSKIKLSKLFNGKLRKYQETALQWLGNMANFGLGVCLADDMGLGKTVEVISFLLHRYELTQKKQLNDKAVLIVCPTSVLFNWKRELNKFAPILDAVTHHGKNRPKDTKALMEYTNKFKIILTTYGTIRNDVEFLETIPFTGIILDESQNIKNFQTQKTKAIMRLNSQYRIALSGTPIENRLYELWTLFEFLNPSLLGPRERFRKKFILPIENFQDEDKVYQLQKIISPFIMRRVKTDKSIIKDLPEKNEIKIPIEMSDLQKQLYTELVNRTMIEIESVGVDKRKRKGVILKLLTYIKQICNHPFQFLSFDEKESIKKYIPSLKDSEISLNAMPLKIFLKTSIKFKRFVEMIEILLESGEKSLVFTQYRKMGNIIKEFLERKFNIPIIFFHGSLSKNQREKMVDRFQSSDYDSPRIMIVSLKAGGTGLNLTSASTVIHYDRWWNPAVEDQATDRAYRIGQKNRVNVYKFISVATIEEKIDKILEEKRNLADQIIRSKDETFITNLSDEDLRELFNI